MEDIPVLLFVLAGVTVLVGAGAWAAESRSELAKADELDRVAKECLGRTLCAISDGVEVCPSVDRIRALDLSWMQHRVPMGVGWVVSVKVVHPWAEELLLVEGGEPYQVSRTGCDRAHLNAAYGVDGSAIVEVTAFVWA